MTCAEFRRVLPEIMDGGHTVEQDAHLRSCPACSNIVSDLVSIREGARLLRASDEPSPRVWNAIEFTLRQEGIMRDPQPNLALVSPSSRTWRMAWLVPAAAALLVTAGILTRYAKTSHEAENNLAAVASTPAPAVAAMSSDDEQLLAAVASRTPALRATYEANLQAVNAYIHDAEETAQQNPDDEDAQQSVMDAYEQKNMVYEMAYDRSLR
ncbi:MAG TPA: hypothetical protein VGF06_15360 [Terriglobales bacterium]|jgi:hypothetical protein